MGVHLSTAWFIVVGFSEGAATSQLAGFQRGDTGFWNTFPSNAANQTADGRVWELNQQLFMNPAINCHFGGQKKSFFTWKRPASVVAGLKTARHWQKEHSEFWKLTEL